MSGLRICTVGLCMGWCGGGGCGCSMRWCLSWCQREITGLPPTDSSKSSITASAVGTSNEPSTAFNIPRSLVANACSRDISMGYCIHMNVVVDVYMFA